MTLSQIAGVGAGCAPTFIEMRRVGQSHESGVAQLIVVMRPRQINALTPKINLTTN
jgi:hypothetical protein